MPGKGMPAPARDLHRSDVAPETHQEEQEKIRPRSIVETFSRAGYSEAAIAAASIRKV